MSCRSPRTRLSLVGVALVLAVVSACSSAPGSDSSEPEGEASQVSKTSEAKILSNIPRGAKNVDIERKVKLRVESGTFETVQVTGPRGAIIKGRLSPDKTRWVSKSQLQAASRYRITSTPVDSESLKNTFESAFRTRKLSLDEQTYPSFVPTDGQTVGVGMPVVIRFDIPVSNQASIERHLKVTSQPAQVGAFHWISNQEVHWRPRNYWRPGTDVTVKADIGGVPAGDGIYGQMDRTQTFHVGRCDGQQGRHEHPPDAGLPQRQAGPDHPDHDRRTAEVHHQVRHQGHHREVPDQADELRDDRHRSRQR